MLLVPMLLFVLLSPGFIFTIPPGAHRETSFQAIIIHALLFGVCLYALQRYYAPEKKEGFQSPEIPSHKQRQIDASNARRDRQNKRGIRS